MNLPKLKFYQFQNLLPTITFWLVGVVFLAAHGAAEARAQNNNCGLISSGYYTGVEISSGTSDQISGTVWGNSFALNSFGEWETLHLTVSLNYATNQIIPNNHIVSGGTWTLTVFRENAYAGSLYGNVESGTVQFTAPPGGFELSSQKTQIILRATGGLGAFEGKEREAVSSALDITTDLLSRSRETSGFLPLAF